MHGSASLAECRRMDAEDPLAAIRDLFVRPAEKIYLDGNSLGMMPKAALPLMQEVMAREWGEGLVTSWAEADWFDLPLSLGDRIGRLMGAAPGQTVVTDTTSVNLFKAVAAAIRLRPDRNILISDAANFPADLYILQGIQKLFPQIEIKLVGRDGALEELLSDRTIAVSLTQVDFRSGACLDMKEITKQVQAAGALMIWDLAHSTGAVPVSLDEVHPDFAVGCTYKYLNGGPGAPGYLYVAQRHQQEAISPISGWIGHQDPFAFSPEFIPAPDMRQFQTGTPSILSYAPLKASLDIWEQVSLPQVWAKRDALASLFIGLVEALPSAYGISLASPRDPALRGSQIALRHPSGLAIMRTLIREGIIGDFRAPDILRFGFTPLTLSFEEVHHAVETLDGIMKTESWRAMSNEHDGSVT